MANRAAIKISNKSVAIVYSGASGVYLTPEATKKQVNWSSPDIQVGTASVQSQNSGEDQLTCFLVASGVR